MRSFLADGNFWLQTVERAIKTVAQAALSYLTVDAVVSGGIMAVNFVILASVAGLAGVVSVLTSIASGASSAEPDSPSLVPVEHHTTNPL